MYSIYFAIYMAIFFEFYEDYFHFIMKNFGDILRMNCNQNPHFKGEDIYQKEFVNEFYKINEVIIHFHIFLLSLSGAFKLPNPDFRPSPII